MLGDYAWDVLIRTNRKLLQGGDTFGEVKLAPGGSAANVAVWASRCGVKTHFIGKIGEDRFGELAIDDLKNESVEYDPIRTNEHRTANVAVWIDHMGERSMVSGQGADFYLLSSELPIGILQNTPHLHLTAWSFFKDPPRSAARKAAKIVKKHDATISLDPGSFQMIGEMGVDNFLKFTSDLKIDIFFPNLEEGETITGKSNPDDICLQLKDLYPKAIIALKLDKDGAMVFNGKINHIPAATNTIIDATGAGDSFSGAFLSHYLQFGDEVKAAVYAVKISSWVVNRVGARPPIDKQLDVMIK